MTYHHQMPSTPGPHDEENLAVFERKRFLSGMERGQLRGIRLRGDRATKERVDALLASRPSSARGTSGTRVTRA